MKEILTAEARRKRLLQHEIDNNKVLEYILDNIEGRSTTLFFEMSYNLPNAIQALRLLGYIVHEGFNNETQEYVLVIEW